MQLMMQNAGRIRTGIFVAAVLAGTACTACWAIALGQVDNFNDGTTMNWLGASPTNIANGGSSGETGDHGLRIESGLGGQPRLVMYNTSQSWTGNWTAEGIERVEFDVRNPNAFDLSVRLGLAGTPPAGSQGSGDTYLSSTTAIIPANSSWLQASFDVTAAGWQNFNGTDITTTLANVTQFRILHNPSAEFVGAVVEGMIEFDNIRTAAGGGVEGDYNGDGTVDAADYALWRDSLGQSGADLPTDGDGSMLVNIDDYLYWKNRFGGTTGSSSATAIPEPAVGLLMAMLLSIVGLKWGFDSRFRKYFG